MKIKLNKIATYEHINIAAQGLIACQISMVTTLVYMVKLSSM